MPVSFQAQTSIINYSSKFSQRSNQPITTATHRIGAKYVKELLTLIAVNNVLTTCQTFRTLRLVKTVSELGNEATNIR